MTKDENKAKQLMLLTEKQTLENRLGAIVVELTKLRQDICLWNFKTHEEAENEITEVLRDIASNDCEGSYNCGYNFYDQNYTLLDSPIVYTGTLNIEYNLHDKTYYYVDCVRYSFKEAN